MENLLVHASKKPWAKQPLVFVGSRCFKAKIRNLSPSLSLCSSVLAFLLLFFKLDFPFMEAK